MKKKKKQLKIYFTLETANMDTYFTNRTDFARINFDEVFHISETVNLICPKEV